MPNIILFNKPYGVISQFRTHEKHPTLAKYITDKSLRIAGRLDTDSEGLILLTDDGRVNAAITNPNSGKYKTYYAQVEGEPSQKQVNQLTQGIPLKDGLTLPAKVAQIDAPELWERNPPVRFRKTVPTSWLQISICEGKNRQVRRMTAAVGLPTLRLVRMQIDDFHLGDLQPTEHKTVTLSQEKMDTLIQTQQTHAYETARRKTSEKIINKSAGQNNHTKQTPKKRAFGKPVRRKNNK